MTTNPELSDSQREHWEQQLEFARKAVEVAEKMLGIVAIEGANEDEQGNEA